ncbi:MFS transporter [Propioniciclava sinopodophylli]|uniref:MFS transporter n=1 Tax=Propioniciclava sinopodophylli TaxID=1837344 RepID=A0A4Q9KBG0_9ACTN|nr:MFS transporter [Propioniciclava sinopodophylli]TBT82903.1 MFS transporter [Propioniciclava sinopodophylli]
MDDKQRNQVLGVLFVGVLMRALDIAIIGSAMPASQAEFRLTPRQLPWLFSIYVLMQMISTPLWAKLSDFFGRRAIYVLDVAIFAVGSIVVAASHGSGLWLLLLAGRAIQGFGAGGIFPVASAVIGDTFPADKRGRALGLIGAVFGIAFLIGPILGGLLLGFGWYWLFLINIPLALVVIALSWKLLPKIPVATSGGFDWAGMVTLAVALGAFTYGLNEFDPANAAASLARPAENPVFPVHLFANKQLAVAFGITLGAGIGEASTVFLPLLAVLSYGVSASVGSYLLPLVLAMAVGSPVAGRLLDRLGSRVVILAGLVIMAAGLIGISRPGPLWFFIVCSALIGLGLSALLGAPIRYITLNETTAVDRSAAQGMVTTFTSIGQLVAAALVGAVAASFGETAQVYDLSFLGIGLVTVPGLGRRPAPAPSSPGW